MKIRKILSWCLLAMLLLTGIAVAEETLSATYSGGVLDIRWSVQGDCVLTIYRNGWPLSVCRVSGESGGTRETVGTVPGVYSVRLRTETGCLTTVAQNGGADSEPTQTPEAATPVPTREPVITPEATAQPTAQPTATAAPVVTATPAVTATPVPTKAPALTAAPVVTSAPDMGGQSMTSLAAEVVSQVNAERASAGLAPLNVSAELTGAACVRAKEIVELFSHTRPDGSSWSTVSSSAFGENIAKGQSTADRVMASWMSSEGHRANILRESFGSIGVCAWKVDGVIYWVQLFGR